MCAGWVISRKVELILRFKRDKMEKEHQILAKIRQQGFIFINFTEVIDHQPYSDVIQTGIFIYKLQKYPVNRWCKRSSAFFNLKISNLIFHPDTQKVSLRKSVFFR